MVTESLAEQRLPGERAGERDVVQVYICKVRAAIGFALIETVWGQGYRLTPAGIAKVDEALA